MVNQFLKGLILIQLAELIQLAKKIQINASFSVKITRVEDWYPVPISAHQKGRAKWNRGWEQFLTTNMRSYYGKSAF